MQFYFQSRIWSYLPRVPIILTGPRLFISPKCLVMQCMFVFTIVQLLHNSLHTAQAWFHELYVRWPFTPGSHILRLQYVCSPCVVLNQHRLCMLSHMSPYWSVAVYHKHNIYFLFFYFTYKHCYWMCFFSIVILFFTQYSNAIFHRHV